MPGDTKLVRTINLTAYGLTYERYQQHFGDANAEVLGGQLTLYKNSSGATTLVIGAHYTDIVPANSVKLTKGQAQRTADRDIGADGTRLTDLMIDPDSGHYFYRVETQRFDSRWVHWINAADGGVIRKFNAIATDDGTGVKGDSKSMAGITDFHNTTGHGFSGPHYDLSSGANYGGRVRTYDYRNRDPNIYYVTDAVTTKRR